MKVSIRVRSCLHLPFTLPDASTSRQRRLWGHRLPSAGPLTDVGVVTLGVLAVIPRLLLGLLSRSALLERGLRGGVDHHERSVRRITVGIGVWVTVGIGV